MRQNDAWLPLLVTLWLQSMKLIKLITTLIFLNFVAEARSWETVVVDPKFSVANDMRITAESSGIETNCFH